MSTYMFLKKLAGQCRYTIEYTIRYEVLKWMVIEIGEASVKLAN